MNCRTCRDTGRITLYRKVLDFNPSSPLQVSNLIRYFNLKMPRKRGENRETTEARYLKRFVGQARRSGESKEAAEQRREAFQLILDYRERQKLASTYLWQLDANDSVHTTYNIKPSTLRRASSAPNLQNIPKRSDLAQQFRKMLIAAPGHLLIEADAEAIEAVLVGYCAGSEEYVRICKAGLHGFMAAILAKQPIPYDLPYSELRQRCKEAKRKFGSGNGRAEYDTAKRGDHAINYLLSAYGLHDEYAEYFPTLKSAHEYLDLYFSLPFGAAIRKWQQDTIYRAHRETYLENHWRYRHYFWSALTFDKATNSWKPGPDAKRAVAFVPQSDASAIQSEVLRRLAARGEEVRSWLRLVIHDSIVLEVPEKAVDDACKVVYNAMVEPIAELGGLSIGAEVLVGKSLGTMEEWKP